jgi:hypothetical protein
VVLVNLHSTLRLPIEPRWCRGKGIRWETILHGSIESGLGHSFFTNVHKRRDLPEPLIKKPQAVLPVNFNLFITNNEERRDEGGNILQCL